MARGEGMLTRRQALLGLLATGSGALLSACATAPTPTPATAAPTSLPLAASPTTWDQLLDAARKEGKVVVNGAPDADTRDKLPPAFRDAYGIEMEYLGLPSSRLAARAQSERSAGQFTIDVSISGSDGVFATFYRNQWLIPFKDRLLLSDASDPSKWKTGGPWFRDPHQDTVLQLFSTVGTIIKTNGTIVTAQDLPNADALLDAKWTGKICAFDPRTGGSGLSTATAIYLEKGEDYVSKLYKGQNVALSADYQQIADWVALGSYPIGISPAPNYFDKYVAAGVKIDEPDLPDLPPPLGGGFSDVSLWDHAPHPNAALVLANWLASQDGMELLSRLQLQAPVRNDIDPTWCAPGQIPKPGIDYVDVYSYDTSITHKPKVMQYITNLLK